MEYVNYKTLRSKNLNISQNNSFASIDHLATSSDAITFLCDKGCKISRIYDSIPTLHIAKLIVNRDKYEALFRQL